jgi:hypothetical protein
LDPRLQVLAGDLQQLAVGDQIRAMDKAITVETSTPNREFQITRNVAAFPPLSEA